MSTAPKPQEEHASIMSQPQGSSKQHCGVDESTTFTGWATAGGDKLHRITFSPRVLSPKDVEIEVACCAICASDIHMMEEDWCKLHGEIIPGHEISGIISAVGKDASHKVGDRVGAGVIAQSCLDCDTCAAGHEHLCKKVTFIYKDKFKDECPAPSYGGFADRVRLSGDFVYKIPDELPLPEAAPLFCSGASAFAALRNHGAGPGKVVGVKGIGSVGHLALQFAKAMQCKEVVAICDSKNVQEDLVSLGATKIVNSNDKNEMKSMCCKVDLLVVNSFDASTDWDDLFNLVSTQGTVVILAMCRTPIKIPTMTLVHREIKVAGSFQGGRKDFSDMLEFAIKHKVRPWIERVPFEKINEAIVNKKKESSRYCIVLEAQPGKELKEA